MTIRENVNLAPFTTIKVGGPARYFVEVKTEDEAREALAFARGKGLPVFVLGGGSNIVVSDDGFPGLVVRNAITGFQSEAAGDGVRIRVGSGEDWDETVRRAVAAGWAGLQNLSGIPGTVGAAPVQNVGAYGASVDKTIVEVRTIRVADGESRVFSSAACKFGYRDSIFKSEERGKYFITEVVFELVPGGAADVSAYPDLQKYFADRKAPPTLAEMRRAVIEIRSRKGMVILPGYEAFQSVGSFFKNPVVSREEFGRIKTDCPGAWFWKENDGRVKISAACLVEQSGFKKGRREGNVGISPKQPLALVNFGGASAREIIAFAEKVKNAVRDRFGIELEEEAQLVG
jgi:UDP-N-acetylmuramate dehydrogenase